MTTDPFDFFTSFANMIHLPFITIKKRLFQLLPGWIKQRSSLDDLRAEAGLHAEEVVRHVLEAYCLANPECRVIHNGKFEFNVHTAKPTRLEIDHLLITDKTIFIIETKFKSGEITALEFEPRWVIKNGNDMRTMANALKQAKRQNSILKRHFDSNLPIVPLVATPTQAKPIQHW